MSRPSLWFYIIVALILALTSCQTKEPTDTTPSSPTSPAPESTTSGPTPPSEVIPRATATPGSVIFPTGPITLTVWTVEEFAPADADPGGRHLLDQFLTFERRHPEIDLEVVVKRATGPGSIEDYLKLASQVAPAVLPDVTVLSRQMLVQAARLPPLADGEAVIQPLDGLLSPELTTDLFPVANQLGSIDGVLMGVPFMLDFEHLVYNTAILTDTEPTIWDSILASGGPYVFPAALDAPVDTTLMHYLAAGGGLIDEEGLPSLEIDPLTAVFRFYQRANADRVIPVGNIQVRSLAESWNGYRNGNALIAHVNAARYLAGRADLFNTDVAPIPGPERQGRSIVTGWHWAVVTPDPTRQQLAAELLEWLFEPDNLGVWSFVDRWVPATKGAFAIWPRDDNYVQFAREQILASIPRPDDDYYQRVQPRLSQAIRDVLLGNISPAEAAAYSAP